MARIDLSTIGMRLGYAVETVAGTKPDAFKWLKGAKSLPEMISYQSLWQKLKKVPLLS